MSTATQFDVVEIDGALVDAVGARVRVLRARAARIGVLVRRSAPKTGNAAVLAAGGVAMALVVGAPFFGR